MLKALGKYISDSGFEEAFAEPEIYGPATIKQINNGKHMQRSFEPNTTLYVALFCVFMESFVSLQPLIENELRGGLANAAVVTENFKRKEKDLIRENHLHLMTVINETSFFEE